MMKKTAVALLLLLGLFVTVQAQAKVKADHEKLARLPPLLKAKIAKEMPGWIHRSIEPIEGSSNLIIEQWESGEVSIKVAVTQYETEAEASDALRDFKQQLKVEEDATIAKGRAEFRLIKETLPFLGDGGFAWDVKGAEAAVFRKNNFLVSVSIARPEHHYDLSISKIFARHVADVLATQ
jgi:hypothetical protein